MRLDQVRDGWRARRKAWRMPLLALAAAGFALGCALSLHDLPLSLADVRWLPLAVLLLVLAPLNIAYSAANLVLMGHAAQAQIPFGRAVMISAWAQLAELLPIPGAAIVRTGALVQAGATMRRSAEIVLLCSVLWVTMAAAAAGLAFPAHGWLGPALLTGGIGGTGLLSRALARHCSARIGLYAFGLRLAGLALVAVRLTVSFMVIGVALPGLSALAFTLATILGSAASLVPAGLGVGEGLSALFAAPLGVLPAAAFLAAAISRLSGLAANLMLVLALLARGQRPAMPATA